jgi:hypothetical protein
VANLGSIEETKALLQQSNSGPWDAILHNARLTQSEGKLDRQNRESVKFMLNTLVAYVLTCFVKPPPTHYLFLSYSMHHDRDISMPVVKHCHYSNYKLYSLMLALYFSRHFGPKGA